MSLPRFGGHPGRWVSTKPGQAQIADGQPWAGGPALTHSGSNTMWMAVAWLAPKKDFAVVISCNQASNQACNDAALALIADHFKDRER